ANLYEFTRLGDQTADPSRVGREDRGGGVFVDGGLAVRRALVAERDLSHGGEREACPLRVGRAERAIGGANALVVSRDGVAWPAGECPQPDHRRSDDYGADAQPQTATLQLDRGFGLGFGLDHGGHGSAFRSTMHERGIAGKLDPSYYDNLTRRTHGHHATLL